MIPKCTNLLSRRELQLLNLLIEGQSNKELAQNMRISSATVKQYLRVLFLKFSVSNRTQLAIRAMNQLKTHSEAATVSPIHVLGGRMEEPQNLSNGTRR